MSFGSVSLLPLTLMATVSCSRTAPAPSPCPPCNFPKKLGFGAFQLQAKRLLSYRLPADLPVESEVRQEPWVFRLTVGLDGRPCAVELLRGTSDDFADAVSAAIRDWRFSPFTTSRGEILCFQSKLFVYVRQVNGHADVIVPGVTDLGKGYQPK